MPPFLVLGLPRSRTAWLARFLSYGEWHCGHEELRHCRSLDDARAWLSQDCTGSAETAAAPFWRLARRLQPDLRVVVVRRPVEDVVASLARLGFPEDRMRPLMARLARKLDQIAARWPGALVVNFADLADEATCARVFEHCLPYQHDPAWWARWAPVNVQCDMHAMVRYAQAYAPQIDRLAKVAKYAEIVDLMSRRPADTGEVVIQEEPFDVFYRDGQKLFDEHLVRVGEAPGDHALKNLPLMRKLYDIGALQVLTARCNGRMFGYLMTILSPSLEARDRMTAVHTTFFADKSFCGLGMRLQREALSVLKAKGVDEVYFRAGVRGSGPKMGVLYRRLGAEEFGQFYKLELS